MDEDIMRKMGFGKEVGRRNAGLCPFCNEKVERKDFRDDLSWKEFGISGLCQKCQDKTFGTGEEA